MYCTKCGVELAERDIYCSQCGTATSNADQQICVRSAPKRLMRSVYDNKLAGVCAGIAHYFGVDPTLVRLIWLVLVFTPPGAGIIAYIIAWIIIPREPYQLEGPAAIQESRVF